MNPDPQAARQTARTRLERLEGFLREDPRNQSLLVDAFETALACGEFASAERLLGQGLGTSADLWGWRLKQGDLLLAQHRYEKAHEVLTSLQQRVDVPPSLVPVLLHNLSYIDLQRGAYPQSAERLAPLMEAGDAEPDGDPTLLQALQLVWLRALHRTGELDRAMDWARTTDAAQRLTPQAAGVAGQIALDADDLQAAQRWTQMALEQGPPTLEGLTTAASLTLGRTDADGARRLCQAALQLKPEDGRAWSVLGYADMLAQDMPKAESSFRQAVSFMPEHIGTWHGLALALVLQGRLDEAKAIYEETLEMDRNFAESHGGLAIVLALQEKTALARESLERAKRLDPKSVSGAYAQALLASDSPEEAQKLLKRIIQFNQKHRQPH